MCLRRSRVLRCVLNPQKVGFQNRLSAAAQPWVEEIFCRGVRLVLNVDLSARNGLVGYKNFQLCGGLLRDCVRQATGDGSCVLFFLVGGRRRMRMMAARHFRESDLLGTSLVSYAGTRKNLAASGEASQR